MKVTPANIRKYYPEIILQLRAEIKRDPVFMAKVEEIKKEQSGVSEVRKSVMRKAGIN